MIEMLLDWNTIPEDEFEKYKKRVALVETLLDESIDIKERRETKRQYCDENQITDRTIRSYVKRYKKKGPAGLLFYNPRPPSLRIQDRMLRRKIKTLIVENPLRSVPKIRELLSLDKKYSDKISQVSDRTIYRFLTENGMSQRERYSILLKTGRRAYHQFEAPHSMALVQGDARDGIWIITPSGKTFKTYLFLWICDYSRKILFGKYYENEKLPCMEDSFRHMLLRYGIPLKIYLDNGKVYVSRHFSAILSELKIKQIHHKPYAAYAKGKIESVNKTILIQFQSEAQRAGISTLEELNTAFWAWCEMVYNKRIHSSTGQTPDTRFLEGLLEKGIQRIDDIEKFNAMFLQRENRTITKYGKIKLKKNQYPVTSKPYGTVVQARFDPFDLTEIKIYDLAHNLLELTTPSKLVNVRDPDIDEKAKKDKTSVSLESKNYFTRLREKYLKEKKLSSELNLRKIAKRKDKDNE